MKNRYPTPEELYALEQEARALRAAELGRLLQAGARAVSSLLARASHVRNAKEPKGLRHA